MSETNPAKLEFTIYNLPFRLRAPVEEHDRLRRAAKHVDELMKQLSESQVTPDTAKLALQAALRKGFAAHASAAFLPELVWRAALALTGMAMLAALVLIAFDPQGAWLVMKLGLVMLAVLVHLYLGITLFWMGRGKHQHGAIVYQLLGWVPLALLLGIAAPATAGQLNLAHTAFAPISGTTSIPIGHSEFCKLHRDECGSFDRVVEATVLDERRWQQLVDINNTVNSSIVPVTDAELYQVDEFWAYPDGYGDCEDIALEKRRQLIEAGWEPSTLLIAVVREHNGNGHAVLMVRTDRGALVLDNQDGMIRVWTETPYQYVKRQSQQHAGIWVDIIDDRVAVASVP